MATKEEIAAAARGKFLTAESKALPGVSFRELPGPESAALDVRLWQKDAEGNDVVEERGGKKFPVPVKGVHHNEEWLAATMTPAFTVDELLGPDWPESLKLDLCREAKNLNGFNLKDAVGNS